LVKFLFGLRELLLIDFLPLIPKGKTKNTIENQCFTTFREGVRKY